MSKRQERTDVTSDIQSLLAQMKADAAICNARMRENTEGARRGPAPGSLCANALAARRAEVDRLHRTGMSMTEIAKKLRLSYGTVRNDVLRIQEAAGV